MGSVKIDIHKAEHQFHRVTFSDVNCIKGLICFRSKIDSYQGIEQHMSEDVAGDVKPFNAELFCIYLDLDNLIKETKLNDSQMDLINKLMIGWTEGDIANDRGVVESSVANQLNRICTQIKNTNDLKWKYDYIYMNYFKSPWNFKRCKTCGVIKPVTKDFFSPNSNTNDGFLNQCRSCR